MVVQIIYLIYMRIYGKSTKGIFLLFDKEKIKVNNSFKSAEEWVNQLLLNYIELEDWIQNESDLINLSFLKKHH